MSETTPGCGSNSESRKRAAATPDPTAAEPKRTLITEPYDGHPDTEACPVCPHEPDAEEWISLDDWFRRVGTRLSNEDYEAGVKVIAAHDAQVRASVGAEIAEAATRVIDEHADYMEGYTLPALSPGFIDGWRHAIRILRRDAGFIAARIAREVSAR